MHNSDVWYREKQETLLAVDELLLKWEELEQKKKLLDISIFELRKDVTFLTRELSQTSL